MVSIAERLKEADLVIITILLIVISRSFIKIIHIFLIIGTIEKNNFIRKIHIIAVLTFLCVFDNKSISRMISLFHYSIIKTSEKPAEISS